MILYHKVAAKCRSFRHFREKMAWLSDKGLYVNTLWLKVMRTYFSLSWFEPVIMLQFFVLYFVNCNKSELVQNFQL